MLRRIYEPRTDEVAGEWRRLHNEESATNIIPVIKPRRMRWAEHVECMGARTAAYWVLMGGGELRQGDHLKDPGVDQRVILKWIFEK